MKNFVIIHLKKEYFPIHLLHLIAFFPLLDYGISAILLVLFILSNFIINGLKVTSLWFFSAFFIYLFIISLFSSSFQDTTDRLSNSFVLIAMPVFLSSIKTKKSDLLKFVNIYIGVIAFKSVICLTLLFKNKSFITGSDIQVLSTEFHGTYFSYEVIIGILLVYYLIESKYKMIFLVFLSITIILFQKKIALLVLLLFWIFHTKKNKQYYSLLLIPIGTLILYFKTGYFEKIKLLIDKSLNFNLVGEDRVRMRLLEAGWYNFIEAPYFGKGVVEHTKFFSEYNLIHLGAWSQDYNTHNYFLFILCSGGVFALILFMWPYIYFLIKTVKNCKVFFMFLIITLFFNFTESFLDRYNGALPFALFCIVFFNYYLENKKIKT